MKNKTNIMATALRAAAMITASAGLASAQGVVAGGAGVNMESTGSIINGSINTFPNGTTITWASTPGLQGFFVPAGQLTGLTPTGEEVSYEDLIPLKSTSISVMSGAPGAAPTGTGTLIDDTGISTNGLSLLDTSTGSLVDIAVTDGTLTVGGAPVTGGGGTTDGVLGDEIFGVIDAHTLGYVPSDTDTAATAPATIVADSLVYTKEGTATYAGHSYAFYSNSNTALPSLGWGQAFDAARDMGGYLGTFTTPLEWLEVHTALASTPNLSGARLWIGCTQAQSGVDERNVGQTATYDYRWITRENAQANFDEISSPTVFGGTRAFNNFLPGQPDNNPGTEGFIEMISASSGAAGTTFGWNDVREDGANVVRGFVVEFQQ